MSLRVLAFAFGAAFGCSAPANLHALVDAEQAERAGDDARALAAYERAQAECPTLPARRRRLACAHAHLGPAELLERRGDPRAASAFERAARQLDGDGGDRAAAAQATYKAGQLRLRAGDATGGWGLLWRTVTDFPDEAHASDALSVLVDDGRRRDAAALFEQLATVVTALTGTGVADNLLWAMAELCEHELKRPQAARALLDRIPREYPSSGLRDDARYRAAVISRRLGDARGAVERLRALVATREVAFGAGSYFSIWLDDAQLDLGRVLRDDLRDLSAALAAFRQLAPDYPASPLIDDAKLEIAVTLERAGRRIDACAALADLLRAFPDTRAGLDGIKLRAAWTCQPHE